MAKRAKQLKTPEQIAFALIRQHMPLTEYGDQDGSLNVNDVDSLAAGIAAAIAAERGRWV